MTPDYSFPGYSKFHRPRTSALSLAAKCYFYVVSFVLSLFFSRSPTAVFFAVRTIVILAVNRMFWGRIWPHIFEKVLEGIQPSLANRYAPASVVFEVRVFGICAAADNCGPTRELGRKSHTVGGISFGYVFCPNAPTAHRQSLPKVSSIYDCVSPAITQAAPERSPVLDMRKLQDRKPTESLARNVLETVSSFSVNRLSHKLNSYFVLVRAHFQRLTGDGLALLSWSSRIGAT